MDILVGSAYWVLFIIKTLSLLTNYYVPGAILETVALKIISVLNDWRLWRQDQEIPEKESINLKKYML